MPPATFTAAPPPSTPASTTSPTGELPSHGRRPPSSPPAILPCFHLFRLCHNSPKASPAIISRRPPLLRPAPLHLPLRRAPRQPPSSPLPAKSVHSQPRRSAAPIFLAAFTVSKLPSPNHHRASSRFPPSSSSHPATNQPFFRSPHPAQPISLLCAATAPILSLLPHFRRPPTFVPTSGRRAPHPAPASSPPKHTQPLFSCHYSSTSRCLPSMIIFFFPTDSPAFSADVSFHSFGDVIKQLLPIFSSSSPQPPSICFTASSLLPSSQSQASPFSHQPSTSSITVDCIMLQGLHHHNIIKSKYE